MSVAPAPKRQHATTSTTPAFLSPPFAIRMPPRPRKPLTTSPSASASLPTVATRTARRSHNPHSSSSRRLAASFNPASMRSRSRYPLPSTRCPRPHRSLQIRHATAQGDSTPVLFSKSPNFGSPTRRRRRRSQNFRWRVLAASRPPPCDRACHRPEGTSLYLSPLQFRKWSSEIAGGWPHSFVRSSTAHSFDR